MGHRICLVFCTVAMLTAVIADPRAAAGQDIDLIDDASAALESLKPLLQDRDVDVRRAAFNGTQDIGWIDADLLFGLLESPDDREWVADRMRRTYDHSPELIAKLAALLGSDDTTDRRIGLRVCAAFSRPIPSLAPLCRKLADNGEQTVLAARAFAHMAETGADIAAFLAATPADDPRAQAVIRELDVLTGAYGNLEHRPCDAASCVQLAALAGRMMAVPDIDSATCIAAWCVARRLGTHAACSDAIKTAWAASANPLLLLLAARLRITPPEWLAEVASHVDDDRADVIAACIADHRMDGGLVDAYSAMAIRLVRSRRSLTSLLRVAPTTDAIDQLLDAAAERSVEWVPSDVVSGVCDAGCTPQAALALGVRFRDRLDGSRRARLWRAAIDGLREARLSLHEAEATLALIDAASDNAELADAAQRLLVRAELPDSAVPRVVELLVARTTPHTPAEWLDALARLCAAAADLKADKAEAACQTLWTLPVQSRVDDCLRALATGCPPAAHWLCVRAADRTQPLPERLRAIAILDAPCPTGARSVLRQLAGTIEEPAAVQLAAITTLCRIDPDLARPRLRTILIDQHGSEAARYVARCIVLDGTKPDYADADMVAAIRKLVSSDDALAACDALMSLALLEDRDWLAKQNAGTWQRVLRALASAPWSNHESWVSRTAICDAVTAAFKAGRLGAEALELVPQRYLEPTDLISVNDPAVRAAAARLVAAPHAGVFAR